MNKLNSNYVIHKMIEILGIYDEPKTYDNHPDLDTFWKKVMWTKNLWSQRGKNYEDPMIEYPHTVHLNSLSDFDSRSHRDVLISFPPGGSVGDSTWDIQYYHNSSVLAEYHDKKHPNPPLILYHHIIIPKKSKMIEIYVGDNCLTRESVSMLESRDIIMNIITPPINKIIDNEHVLYFIDTYGLNSYDDMYKNKIKCLCDGNEVVIHFLEKPVDLPHIDGYDRKDQSVCVVESLDYMIKTLEVSSIDDVD
jgi:hypothetical protein